VFLSRLNNISFVGLLLIVFVVPLAAWDGFLYAATFTKTFLFIAIVEYSAIFWLPQASLCLRRHAKNPISIFVLVFFIVATIVSFFAQDFSRSVWSNYERMMGLWTLTHVLLFFFITTNICRDYKKSLWLLRSASLAALIVSLIGIFEFIGSSGAARVEGPLRNAAFLASYLLLTAFIALWLTLREDSTKKEALLWGCVFLLSCLALFLTATRGALVGLAGGLGVLSILVLLCAPEDKSTLGLRNKLLKKYVTVGWLLCIVLLSGAILFRERLARSSFDPISRLASISFKDNSFQGRLKIWRVGWEGWRARFLGGWGVENIDIMFNEKYDPGLIDLEPWIDRAHNVVLDMGIAVGFVGLGAYFGIFIASIIFLARGWKKRDVPFWMFSVFTALLTAHFIQNLFVFDSITSLLILFTVFAFIAARAPAVAEDNFPRRKNQSRAFVLLLLGAMVVVPLFYVGAWGPFWENRHGKRGYDAFAFGDDEEGFREIETALAYDTYGNIDVRRSVAEYVFEFLKQGGKRDPQALRRVIDYAIQKMEENIKERPGDVKWYMYQGQLYNLGAVFFPEVSQEYAAYAEKRYLESAKLSPGRPQIYLEIAQARSVLKNIPGVWEAMDTAEHLAPDYGAVYINGVVHAIALGDRKREAQYMAKLTALEAIDVPALRDAYYKVGRLDETIAMENRYIQRLESQRDVSKKTLAVEYKNLAVFHKEAGHIPEARAAALKVIELDPSQRQSAEAFLQFLGK